MRVVSGTARGVRLDPVPGDTTRPILDRVKTSLFDVLRPELADTRWLDLFAGTGQVGIEALSQGAAHCTFLDIEPKAIATIRKNLEKTKLQALAEVRHTDALSFLKNTAKTFDVIYIAPPQYKGLWLEALRVIAERSAIISEANTITGQVIVQIDPSEYEPFRSDVLVEQQQRKYGNTLLVWYRGKE